MSKASILDNIERMKAIDRSNMLSFCVDASKHYEKAVDLAAGMSIEPFRKPSSVVVAGMGGSGIGGELLKDWARDKINVPIEICRDYSLPAYVNSDSLVFLVSYSGETEESLSVFLEAVKRKCKIISISSGGTLQRFCRKLHIPHLLVPSGMAPRATLPYLFMPLPIILEKLGFVSGVEAETSEAVEILKTVSAECSPDKPSRSNPAKRLASEIRGTVPVVYGFGLYRAVAQRFKTQFNENSKVPAKWEVFPELNHNEIVGWEGIEKLASSFSVTLIRDDAESVAIKQRIETTKELMQQEGLRVFEVRARGKGNLAKMCSVICFGDFVSVYLAVLRGVDPTPVKSIAFLKEKLEESGFKEKVVRELKKLG